MRTVEFCFNNKGYKSLSYCVPDSLLNLIKQFFTCNIYLNQKLMMNTLLKSDICTHIAEKVLFEMIYFTFHFLLYFSIKFTKEKRKRYKECFIKIVIVTFILEKYSKSSQLYVLF